MTPPRTIVGQVMAWPVFANNRLRRVTFAVLAVILAVLSLWPRPYLARAQMLPNLTNGMLSSLLGGATAGGAGVLQSLLGGVQSAEVDLDLARSQQVLLDVAAQMRAKGPPWNGDGPKVIEKLRRAADIEVIRGGILQISVINHDPQLARDMVQAFVSAVQRRIAAVSAEQADQKKAAASKLMGDASTRLQQAEATMDQFRSANHLASPPLYLATSVTRLAGLQAALAAEQTALGQILKFATPQSFEVQSAQARIAALQKEIAQEQTRPQTPLSGPNLEGLTPKISTYENLYRSVLFAQAEYLIYQKYMESLAADEVSAPLGVSVVQPAYVSSQRQYNMRPLGLLAIVLLIVVCAEFYVAKRPPGEGR